MLYVLCLRFVVAPPRVGRGLVSLARLAFRVGPLARSEMVSAYPCVPWHWRGEAAAVFHLLRPLPRCSCPCPGAVVLVRCRCRCLRLSAWWAFRRGVPGLPVADHPRRPRRGSSCCSGLALRVRDIDLRRPALASRVRNRLVRRVRRFVGAGAAPVPGPVRRALPPRPGLSGILFVTWCSCGGGGSGVSWVGDTTGVRRSRGIDHSPGLPAGVVCTKMRGGSCCPIPPLSVVCPAWGVNWLREGSSTAEEEGVSRE